MPYADKCIENKFRDKQTCNQLLKENTAQGTINVKIQFARLVGLFIPFKGLGVWGHEFKSLIHRMAGFSPLWLQL